MISKLLYSIQILQHFSGCLFQHFKLMILNIKDKNHLHIALFTHFIKHCTYYIIFHQYCSFNINNIQQNVDKWVLLCCYTVKVTVINTLHFDFNDTSLYTIKHFK